MALKHISVVNKAGAWDNGMADTAFNEIKFFGKVLGKTSPQLTGHGSNFLAQVWESYFDFDKKTVILVMELADRSLLNEVRRYHTFSDDEIRIFVRGVLQALQWLEHCGVYHNDVKPANVLLFKPSFAHRFVWRVKLTDLGSASSNDTTTQHMLTTYPYAAPELLRSVDLAKITDHGIMPYSHKTDVWSAGVILSELMSEDAAQCAITAPDDPKMSYAEAHLSGVHSFLQHLADNTQVAVGVDSLDIGGAAAGLQLAGALAHPLAEQRPHAAEALQHPWFQEHSATTTMRTPARTPHDRLRHGLTPAEWDSISLALGRSYCLLSGIRGGDSEKPSVHHKSTILFYVSANTTSIIIR